MGFIIFINTIMMLILLGCAVFLALSFVYDIIYYDSIFKLVFDLGFTFISALSIYASGKYTISLLI